MAYGYGIKSDRPVLVKLHEKSAEELGEIINDEMDSEHNQDVGDDTKSIDTIDLDSVSNYNPGIEPGHNQEKEWNQDWDDEPVDEDDEDIPF